MSEEQERHSRVVLPSLRDLVLISWVDPGLKSWAIFLLPLCGLVFFASGPLVIARFLRNAGRMRPGLNVLPMLGIAALSG